MKKILFAAMMTTLGIVTADAQLILDRIGLNPSETGTLLRNKVTENKDKNIQGSPYLNNSFLISEISGVSERFVTRYNAATDEVEIKKDTEEEEAFLLPKSPEYATVNSSHGKYILKLVNYTNTKDEKVYGYLVQLSSKNGVSLLRRDKVNLMKESPGNGYSGAIPPQLVKASPEYYLQLKDEQIIQFPKNKKALLVAFPKDKAKIEAFLKSSKASFRNEGGMMEITDFVATL